MTKLTHNKKPSKKQAFEIVAALHDGDELTQSEKDSLLLYFIGSNNPKKPKTTEQWVATAVAKKEIREALNYMWVDDGVAYGSDGAVVFYGATELDDGFYDPKTLLQVEVGELKYPTVKAVIESNMKKIPNPVSPNVLDEMESELSRGLLIRCSDSIGNYADSYLKMIETSDVVELHKGDGSLIGETKLGKFILAGVRK